MKKAFTMIELIFVIVILGILAAVALPKFLGVANQAHEANLKSFVGTLNRTVGPNLWSQSLSKNKGGSVTSFTLSNYIDIPKEVNKNISLANCGDNNYSEIGEANTTVTGSSYTIKCRDGNATNSPTFLLYKSNTCIAGPCPN
jgi:prepilin-type N-terminal cleavage/methylation domain-containing protein